MSEPSLRELSKWLTSATHPVHGFLYVSTFFRILSLSLDILLFGLAAGGVALIALGGGEAGNLLVWLILIAVLKAICYYGEQLTGHYVAFKALELLRTKAFAQLWPKAPAIVNQSRSGDVLASLTRDVDRIEVVYAHTFAPLVSAIVVPPAFLLGAGVLVGWSVVIIPAICVMLGLFIVPFIGLRRSMLATRRTLRLRRELTHHVTDSIFGTEEVVGYGRVDERLAEMDRIGSRIAESACVARAGNAIRRASNTVLSLAAVIGAVYGARQASLSIPLTAALAAGTLRLFEGPRGIEDAAGYLDHSLAAARRLWNISTSPEIVQDGQEVYAPSCPPSIEFAGVSYAYPTGAFSLKDVSFTVAAGEHIAIVGPSGSGKSTAVSMLLRYDNPTAGQILVDDMPIQRYTVDSLRHAIVLVSQRCQLLNASIRENVNLGVPEAGEEEIWEVLETVCLADEVRSMPKSLDTSVGQSGSRLSGGQAQRLCLARALLMRPRVLVLDEFAANLNRRLEDSIRRNLAKKIPGVTVIEITHRLESARAADRVLLMDRGMLVASGSPVGIEESDGMLADFFHRNV